MGGATPGLDVADQVMKIKTKSRRFKGNCTSAAVRRRRRSLWAAVLDVLAICMTVSAGASPSTVTRYAVELPGVDVDCALVGQAERRLAEALSPSVSMKTETAARPSEYTICATSPLAPTIGACIPSSCGNPAAAP